MPGLLRDPRIWSGVVFSLAAGAIAVAIVLKHRLTAEEKERRRRMKLNAMMRTIEGELTETGDGHLFYHYELSGVAYSASQDISALEAFLPPDPARLIGPVRVKFDPRNPANSIIICEEWSGLPGAGNSNHQSQKEQPA